MVVTSQVTAKDLMQVKLITLHPKDKMDRVRQIFQQYCIHHIPILVAGRVVGIISKSDFLHLEGIARDSFDLFLKGKMFKLHPVEMYMKSDVVCCEVDTPLEKLLDLFLANAIHSVLVTEGDELLGIVTPHDIMKMVKRNIENG